MIPEQNLPVKAFGCSDTKNLHNEIIYTNNLESSTSKKYTSTSSPMDNLNSKRNMNNKAFVKDIDIICIGENDDVDGHYKEIDDKATNDMNEPIAETIDSSISIGHKVTQSSVEGLEITEDTHCLNCFQDFSQSEENEDIKLTANEDSARSRMAYSNLVENLECEKDLQKEYQSLPLALEPPLDKKEVCNNYKHSRGVLLGHRIARDFAADIDSETPVYFMGVVCQYQPPVLKTKIISLLYIKRKDIASLDFGLYRVRYLDGAVEDYSPIDLYFATIAYHEQKIIYGKDKEEQIENMKFPNPRNFFLSEVIKEQREYSNWYNDNTQIDIDEVSKIIGEGNEVEHDLILTKFGFLSIEKFLYSPLKQMNLPRDYVVRVKYRFHSHIKKVSPQPKVAKAISSNEAKKNAMEKKDKTEGKIERKRYYSDDDPPNRPKKQIRAIKKSTKNNDYEDDYDNDDEDDKENYDEDPEDDESTRIKKKKAAVRTVRREIFGKLYKCKTDEKRYFRAYERKFGKIQARISCFKTLEDAVRAEMLFNKNIEELSEEMGPEEAEEYLLNFIKNFFVETTSGNTTNSIMSKVNGICYTEKPLNSEIFKVFESSGSVGNYNNFRDAIFAQTLFRCNIETYVKRFGKNEGDYKLCTFVKDYVHQNPIAHLVIVDDDIIIKPGKIVDKQNDMNLEYNLKMAHIRDTEQKDEEARFCIVDGILYKRKPDHQGKFSATPKYCNKNRRIDIYQNLDDTIHAEKLFYKHIRKFLEKSLHISTAVNETCNFVKKEMENILLRNDIKSMIEKENAKEYEDQNSADIHGTQYEKNKKLESIFETPEAFVTRLLETQLKQKKHDKKVSNKDLSSTERTEEIFNPKSGNDQIIPVDSKMSRFIVGEKKSGKIPYCSSVDKNSYEVDFLQDTTSTKTSKSEETKYSTTHERKIHKKSDEGKLNQIQSFIDERDKEGMAFSSDNKNENTLCKRWFNYLNEWCNLDASGRIFVVRSFRGKRELICNFHSPEAAKECSLVFDKLYGSDSNDKSLIEFERAKTASRACALKYEVKATNSKVTGDKQKIEGELSPDFTKVPGISLFQKKFRASIVVGGDLINVGTYNSYEDAQLARSLFIQPFLHFRQDLDTSADPAAKARKEIEWITAKSRNSCLCAHENVNGLPPKKLRSLSDFPERKKVEENFPISARCDSGKHLKSVNEDLSRFKGISLINGKFRICVRYESKTYYLGVYDTLETGLKARCFFMVYFFPGASVSNETAVENAKKIMKEKMKE